MIKKIRWLLISLAVVLCLGVSPVLAEESQAYVLTGEAVGGVLAGDAAGSFNYYRVNYPGNSTDVRIQLSVWPYDAVTSHTAGFNVYGPDGYMGKGTWKSDDGYLEVTYDRDEAAELTVQVYNYGSAAVSYSITVTGLPEETTATTATATAEVSTSTATTTTTEGTSFTAQGALVGNTGGAVNLYHVVYAGEETDCTVTMTFEPADPCFGKAFGINIYDASGNVVAQGTHTDLYNVMEATFNTDVEGTYTVQVFNYTDGISLYYTLEVAQ